jgi:hypothetical protein
MKKYLWLLIPGGSLVVLYLLLRGNTAAPTAFNGNVGASQGESGNPASGDNNTSGSPGGPGQPYNPGGNTPPVNQPSPILSTAPIVSRKGAPGN